MAHPYSSSREDKVGKSRASKMVKGYDTGGAVKKYATGGSISPVKKAGGGEIKVPGMKSGGRLDKFARGGAAKKKPQTQVNIAIVSPQKEDKDEAPMMPPMPPPIGAAPPPPPPKGPPGAGPGMPVGGPLAGPMSPPGMMKRGGGVKMKGGADTGVGRLDKIKIQKRAEGGKIKPIKPLPSPPPKSPTPSEDSRYADEESRRYRRIHGGEGWARGGKARK